MTERIVVISDINGSYGSTEYNPRVKQAVERIQDMQPDLVISAGDMVAGQKQPRLGSRVRPKLLFEINDKNPEFEAL